MNDIRVSQLADEQWPVAELCDDCSRVLDTKKSVERRGWYRIDRDDPRLNLRIVAPPVEHPHGLNGLPAKNPQRCNDEGDAKTRRGSVAHTVGPDLAPSRCKRTDLSGSLDTQPYCVPHAHFASTVSTHRQIDDSGDRRRVFRQCTSCDVSIPGAGISSACEDKGSGDQRCSDARAGRAPFAAAPRGVNLRF
jgi:hypothetical protein